ncbi:MAG: heme ABC exporter ATP-binding protein CcmA [Rhodanobacteraceae bacterium]
MQELVISDLEVWRGDYCACAGWRARIAPGQLLRLGGGNGAGKTTLMRVFAGLALPESGTVYYGARAAPRSVAYRECLRYVAHRDGVKPELSAQENLRLAARLAADSSPEETAAALRRVGLGSLGERRAAELSAGQRRRLALARLLLGKAGLWLLDEPLVGLDRSAVGLVAELMREHLAGGGIAVVATHQTLPLAGVDMLRCDLPHIAREEPFPAEMLET